MNLRAARLGLGLYRAACRMAAKPKSRPLRPGFQEELTYDNASVAVPVAIRTEARAAEALTDAPEFMRSQAPDVEACIRELLIRRRVAAQRVALLRTLDHDQLDPPNLAKYKNEIMRWSRILDALSPEMLERGTWKSCGAQWKPLRFCRARLRFASFALRVWFKTRRSPYCACSPDCMRGLRIWQEQHMA